MYVTCVRWHHAGLTAGNKYKVYGRSKYGIIVRNDFGMMLTYADEFFA